MADDKDKDKKGSATAADTGSDDLFDADEMGDDENGEGADDGTTLDLDDEPDDNGKAQLLASVLEGLADCGIKLPDDTQPNDLLENLNAALVAYKHAREHHGIETPGAGSAGSDTGGSGGAGASPVATEEPMGTQMSLDTNGTGAGATKQPAAPANPATLDLSIELDNLKNRTARAEKIAAEERLKGVTMKLKALVNAGDLSPARAKQWHAALTARQLSLVAGDDREVAKILDQMEILEQESKHRLNQVVTARQQAAQPAGAPAYVDFSTAVDGDKPEAITADRAKKILDEVYGTATAAAGK